MRLVKASVLLAVVCFICLFFSACGGSNSGNDPTDYNGTWDVRYNLLNDECGFARGDVLGITDQHFITQDETGITLDSLSDVIRSDTGEIREDGSLLVSETLVQDFFGVGFPCELMTRITYSNFDADAGTADSLLSQTISCGGDLICESQGIGSSLRQREPENTVVVEDEG